MTPRTVRFLALVAVLAATRAPGDQAPSVQVMVDEVDDKRTTGTFFAECDVKLKVMGDDVASALGIRAVRVVAAADDTGRDLKSDKEQGDMFFEANRDKKAVLQTTVKLANPARNAKTIRTLRGEVELFHPTAENGGIVTARDFLAKPGVPIAAPGLMAAKISLMYVTKDVLEAKKQELQKQAGDAAKDKVGDEFAEALSHLVSGMFGMFSTPGPTLQFLVVDPDKRMVDLAFVNRAGNPLKTSGHTFMGELRSYTFQEQPPPDTQLVVYVATARSTSVARFSLTDVPLP